jgi:hypothetical protein
MLKITIIPNIDDSPWRDLFAERASIITLDGGELQIAGMPDEYGKDRSGVALRLNLADGRAVIAQTSLALFLNAARALEGRYPAEALSPRMSDEQMREIQGLILRQLDEKEG